MAERELQLPEGVPPLRQYYVYMTGGCNLACRHCWINPTYQAHGGTGGHLDYDLFALAIEEGLPLGLGFILGGFDLDLAILVVLRLGFGVVGDTLADDVGADACGGEGVDEG